MLRVWKHSLEFWVCGAVERFAVGGFLLGLVFVICGAEVAWNVGLTNHLCTVFLMKVTSEIVEKLQGVKYQDNTQM